MTVITISSGVTSSGLTVSSGVEVDVLSGGTAENFTVASGGLLVLSSGSDFSGVTVNGGGFVRDYAAVVVSSGQTLAPGVATIGQFTISGGGDVVVYNIDLQSGGSVSSDFFINGAGAFLSLTLESGVTLSLSSGAGLDCVTISSGGELLGPVSIIERYPAQSFVEGLISGATLAGFLNLNAGGVADSITMSAADSELVVYSGGVASATTVGQGTTVFVNAGGVAENDLILSDGLEVLAGGAASGTVLSGAGASEQVSSGGWLSAAVVGSGGVADVFAGGSAVDITVSSGGRLAVAGSATTIDLAGGTFEFIGAGEVTGLTGSGVVEYGSGVVNSDQSLSSTNFAYEIGAGETFNVSAGQLASGVTVIGELVVSGEASNTILDGGVLEQVAGGSLVGASGTGTIIYGSGLVLSGATLESPTVVLEIGSAAALDDSDVTAASTLIVTAGAVMSGGTVEGALIGYGVMSDVAVDGPAPAAIWSGASFNGGDIGSGATLVAYDAAVASGVTMEGTLIAGLGGVASATILDGGVLEQVAGGQIVGAAGTGTIIYGSGMVLSGATLDAASIVLEIGDYAAVTTGTVTSESTLVVAPGATVDAMTVNGEMMLDSGAAIGAGGLTLNGGEAVIGGAVSAGQAVTFSGSGGHLVIDDVATFGAVISGFSTSGQEIDLGGYTYSAGETVTWTEAAGNASGTLTVSGAGMTANLTLLGDYATSNFSLSDDGVGGTLITDPAGGGGGAIAAGHSTAASSPIIGGHVASFAQAMAVFSEPLTHPGWMASAPSFGFGQANSALLLGGALSGTG